MLPIKRSPFFSAKLSVVWVVHFFSAFWHIAYQNKAFLCFLYQVSVEELKSGAGAGWRISCDPGQPFCTLPQTCPALLSFSRIVNINYNTNVIVNIISRS